MSDATTAITPTQLRNRAERIGAPTAGVDFEKLAECQNDATRAIPGWVSPEPPTHEWRLVDRDDHGGGRYVNARASLVVLLSCGREEDGRAWLHLSVSRLRKDRLPSWGELSHVKRLFIGDRYAYQVIPPQAAHVSLAEVLHMFALLDEHAPQPLPDFTAGTGSI